MVVKRLESVLIIIAVLVFNGSSLAGKVIDTDSNLTSIINKLYTYKYSDQKNIAQKVQDKFTPEAWSSYLTAYQTSGNDAIIKDRKLSLQPHNLHVQKQYAIGANNYTVIRANIKYLLPNKELFANYVLIFTFTTSPNQADLNGPRLISHLDVNVYHDPNRGYRHPGCKLHLPQSHGQHK